MAMPKYASVEAYLAAQSPSARARLRKVRSAVKKAVRGLEESVTYGIPTYESGGKAVVFFAAWKEHYSLYPASAKALAAAPELAPFEAGKGTVKIPYDVALTDATIARFTRARAAEIAEVKPTKKPTRRRAR